MRIPKADVSLQATDRRFGKETMSDTHPCMRVIISNNRTNILPQLYVKTLEYQKL